MDYPHQFSQIKAKVKIQEGNYPLAIIGRGMAFWKG